MVCNWFGHQLGNRVNWFGLEQIWFGIRTFWFGIGYVGPNLPNQCKPNVNVRPSLPPDVPFGEAGDDSGLGERLRRRVLQAKVACENILDVTQAH